MAADLVQVPGGARIPYRNLVATGIVPADRAARLRSTMEDFSPEAMVVGHELLERLHRIAPNCVAAVRRPAKT